MKRILSIIIILCFFYLLQIKVYSNESKFIVYDIISNEIISAYINDIGMLNCSAFLGTSECEINSYTKAGDLPSNTLILIDTSGSIPQEIRTKTSEFLSELIDGKQENESFAIAALGMEMNMICDYTTDRYDLIKAVSEIKYDEKATYLYSSINDALSSLPDDKFGKIVVISDGMENNKDGITYDEILMSVSEKICPIYTIGVEKNNNESLKKFYAFSRNSSAKSYTLVPNTDVSEVCEIINETRNYTCIDIAIPDGAADGSVKYLKISGDGFECGCDIRMPIVASENTEITVTENSSVTAEIQTELSYTEPDAEENSSVKYIIIAASVAVIIGVIITIVAVKSKKKGEKSIVVHTDPTPVENDETKIDPQNPTIVPTSINECVIKLTDINAPEHSFRCALGNGVIIGRNPEQSMIVIDYDGYVARRHCRIWRENGKFYIENFSKNKVVINDKIIVEKAAERQKITPASGTEILIPNTLSNSFAKEVSDGDILKIGHTLLKLEII